MSIFGTFIRQESSSEPVLPNLPITTYFSMRISTEVSKLTWKASDDKQLFLPEML